MSAGNFYAAILLVNPQTIPKKKTLSRHKSIAINNIIDVRILKLKDPNKQHIYYIVVLSKK